MEKKDLELYVHIPFCKQKCNYCDFLSFQADEETKEQYVNTVIQEIVRTAPSLSDYRVSTIFFGGGTPSILQAGQIARIMDTIDLHFQKAPYVESTIECNPGTITAQKIEQYLDCGLNRISFGLQSAHDAELRGLGRIHTVEEFVDSYLLARNYGFCNINVDLMAALPYQTLDSFCATLHSVAGLKPEHLSVYSLIVEENTPLYHWVNRGNEDKLPSEEVEREMYYKTKEILHEYGYERYEISNYAKPGYECRHNLGYWNRTNYVGFGLGAASLLENRRYQNCSDMKSYLEHAGSVKDNEEILSIQDAMAEYMFLGLRRMKGISTPDFTEQFGVPYHEVYGDLTKDLLNRGLLCQNGQSIYLSDYGIDVSNRVMAEFLFEE